jgi:RND family efflux transporter MFP subunit
MSHVRAVAPAVLAASLSLGLVACGPAKQDDPRSATPLVRTDIVQDAGAAGRVLTGTVVARVQSDLGFRVPGKIVERLVEAGQTVRRGQPLMRIDATDLKLATRAEDEAVAATKARASQIAADERRYRGLVSAGAVSASAYDQIRAAADTAQAQLRAAQARADVARNEAGYAVLVADADGVVMSTLGEPGQVVAAGQTVVRVARSGPREAVVDLSETFRPALGSMGRAALYGGAGLSGDARLRQLSDAANPQTRTFEARYVLEGPIARAPLGATVTLHVPDPRAATGGAAVRVPLAAVHDRGDGPGVWIVEGAKPRVVWRGIRLAAIGDETATVAEGLEAGERFAALGAHLLHDGESVRVAGARQ